MQQTREALARLRAAEARARGTCEHAGGCRSEAAVQMRSPNGLRRACCHEHVQSYLDSGWEMC